MAVRYLILSDLHANLEALEAVLAAAADGWDQVLVLGDLVGYGADPNAVVERIRSLKPAAVIRGNHDKASCGLDDGEHFNQIARVAAVWTEGHLTADNRTYLRGLPAGPTPIDQGLEICHGAPFDEDHYIFDAADAQHAFHATLRPVCLFGHTHLPVVFGGSGTQVTAAVPQRDLHSVTLQGDARYLINPGSVGQPRDGDPRAAFGVYSTAGTFTFRRVDYDVAGAQRRICAAGLPQSLANRLSIGR